MNNNTHNLPARPDIGLDAESELIDDPSEGCISLLSLILALLLISALMVGLIFGAAYWLQHFGISELLRGIGLAAFLPAWRDHHTADRQEWIREQGEGPHVVEKWTLRLCLVAFAVLMVSGYFGGAA